MMKFRCQGAAAGARDAAGIAASGGGRRWNGALRGAGGADAGGWGRALGEGGQGGELMNFIEFLCVFLWFHHVSSINQPDEPGSSERQFMVIIVDR